MEVLNVSDVLKEWGAFENIWRCQLWYLVWMSIEQAIIQLYNNNIQVVIHMCVTIQLYSLKCI